ncbi:MAG: restriction endonuclease subunit S [Methylobacter sp.]|nr:restriction endonuclease subunit S [Candidatus Methylobacter titanis]
MSWPIKRLSTVAQINPSRNKIIREDNTKTSFVPMEGVDGINGIVIGALNRPYAEIKKGYTYFEENDVIFAKITPCMQNGKHAIATDLIDGIGFGSTEFHVIRCSEDIIPEWVHYYLRRQETLNAAIKTFNGAVGQQRVPTDFLENLAIPVPSSVETQRLIAAKLKAQLAEVETARKALAAQQADIKLLAATALDKLYSYSIKNKLGDVAKIQSGYAFKSKDFITQGIKLLRNTNILPNKIYWDDTAYLPSESFAHYPNYVIHEGDVILSLDRPIISTGIKVACISEKDIPALLVQRVGRFLIDKNRLDPSYLYFFLNTSFFKDAISGHEQSLGVPHISPSQVEGVEIPLPDVEEQKKIAATALEIFREIEIAKIAAKEAQKDIELLSSRLLAHAFDPLSAQ